MIDFGCKRFSLDEIIKCSFGLTKADLSIFQHFVRHADGWHTTNDVADAMGLTLSTVQRAVKKLHERDVLDRGQNNLDNGGYQFVYQFKGQRAFKKQVVDILNGWVARAEKELESMSLH
jgi:predicted transcriptional regulator